MAVFSPTVEFLSRAFRRSAAFYLYHSGKLRELKARSIANGALPWRILRYERVVNPEELSFPISPSAYVRPKTFATHLRYLKAECSVLTLHDLLQRLDSGKDLPHNPVALTFDCGYAELYQHAFPLLQRYQVPASVFLPTAFIGTLSMFWEEKISAALSAMAAAGRPLPRLSFFSDDINQAFDLASPDNKITPDAASLFIDLLPTFSEEERELALAFIGVELEQLGDIPAKRTFLDWEEVLKMQQAGISFGMMGHAYKLFPGLTREGIAEDLRSSLAAFRQHGLQPMPVISLPYGMTDERVNHELAAIGVKAAMGLGLEAMDFSTPGFRVYGRLNQFQDPVFCRDLFACALWGVEAYGIRF